MSVWQTIKLSVAIAASTALVGCAAFNNEWNPLKAPTQISKGLFKSKLEYTLPAGWRIIYNNSDKSGFTHDGFELEKISMYLGYYNIPNTFTECLVGKKAKKDVSPITIQQNYEGCFADNGMLQQKHSFDLTTVGGLDAVQINTTFFERNLPSIQRKLSSYILIDNNNKRLVYFHFDATSDHYYDKYVAEFESLIKSVRTKSGGTLP